MAGSNRRTRRGDSSRRRSAGDSSDGRRPARFAPRPRTVIVIAGLAVGAAALYALNRPATPERHNAVASAPPPTPPAQTRALSIASPPAAVDDSAKTHKPARRETAALAQDDPAIDRWFMEAYLRCWSPPSKIPEDSDYAAKIRVQHNSDGSLAGAPVLVNPPSDPDWRSYADSAVHAVKKCNPLTVPAEYLPRFDHWKKVTLYFSPASAHD